MSAIAERLEPQATDATRQLFETHRRKIFGYCLGQLGNHHDAEDAVQTTFLYAFGCLERGVVPEIELAWLFKIALNVCRTRRRSLGRRRRIEAPTDFDACAYAIAAPERGDDELDGLSGALAAMPANQRSALLLREWQGLSYAEIGERLAISQSAVETLLFRARRSLASQLRRIPQQVAVIANAPLLLRVLRRLAPNAGAIKATAAVVAIGAVAGVGGHELRHSLGNPAPSHTPASRLATPQPSLAPVPHRVPMADASVRPTLRFRRPDAAISAAAAVSKPAESRAAPTAALAPSSSPRNHPVSPVATTSPKVSPKVSSEQSSILKPSLPATSNAVDAATAIVEAVTPPLQSLAGTADRPSGSAVTGVVTAAATVVTTRASSAPSVGTPNPASLLPAP